MPAGFLLRSSFILISKTRPEPPVNSLSNQRPAAFDIAAVRDRQNDRIRRPQRIEFGDGQAVFVLGVRRTCQGIVHLHLNAERFQFTDDVDDAGIARIRNILLEGQAEDR